MINILDRSGLPDHLRDAPVMTRWLILTERGRKVAECPIEDLDAMDSVELENFFTIQEAAGRTWKIQYRREK